MIKLIKKLFKKKVKPHIHEFHPVSVKHGMEVHGFCKCGVACKITDFYH